MPFEGIIQNQWCRMQDKHPDEIYSEAYQKKRKELLKNEEEREAHKKDKNHNMTDAHTDKIFGKPKDLGQIHEEADKEGLKARNGEIAKQQKQKEIQQINEQKRKIREERENKLREKSQNPSIKARIASVFRSREKSNTQKRGRE